VYGSFEEVEATRAWARRARPSGERLRSEIGAALSKAASGLGGQLSDQEALALFQAEGRELEALVQVADDLRSEAVGDEVTYVVNRVDSGHITLRNVGSSIDIGISSQCDSPLVRGGEKGFDQATGRAIGTYYSMPKGTVGGSIWSSAASDGTSLWVTTGNSDPSLPDTEQGDSFSIVQLDGTTMKREKKWTIPGQAHTDRDWGGSPTLFSATIGGKTVSLVGAADKDGYFYAFRRNALGNGPVWKTLIGSTPGSNNDVCIAAAIWDGTRLFAACNLTKIGVTTYDGSVRQLDPATGGVIWERGLDGAVLGSPTLDGAGVIAASTWKGAGPKKKATTYLLDAASGQVLKDYPTSGGSSVFGQPVFADGDLLVASIDQGLFAYKAP